MGILIDKSSNLVGTLLEDKFIRSHVATWYKLLVQIHVFWKLNNSCIFFGTGELIHSLWHGDAKGRHGFFSIWGQAKACYMTAACHLLNQCWQMVSETFMNSSNGIVNQKFNDSYWWICASKFLPQNFNVFVQVFAWLWGVSHVEVAECSLVCQEYTTSYTILKNGRFSKSDHLPFLS